VTESVAKLVSQAAADALNAQTFSLPIEAARHWRAYLDRSAVESPTVTVIPGQRSSRRVTRGGDSENQLSLQVVVQQTYDPISGEIVPVDRCDPIADLSQEVEDYLQQTSLSWTDDGTARKATPTGVASSEVVEDWLTDGVFAVSLNIEYLLVR
jgi:hypothetical protein